MYAKYDKIWIDLFGLFDLLLLAYIVLVYKMYAKLSTLIVQIANLLLVCNFAVFHPYTCIYSPLGVAGHRHCYLSVGWHLLW